MVGVAIESGNDDGKSSSSPTTSDDAYIALPSEDTVLTKVTNPIQTTYSKILRITSESILIYISDRIWLLCESGVPSGT